MHGVTLRTSHIIVLFVLLLVCAVLAFLAYQRLSPNGFLADRPNDLTTIIPEVGAEYEDLLGNPVDLESFKGKIMIINSWASWMPFSRDELIQLDSMAGQHRETIQVIAMNRMEERATIQAYLASLPPLTHILVLRDPADSFYRAVQGYAMPETVFYTKDARIFNHTRGVLSASELELLVAGALANPS